ncbi:hypothetical protein B0G71_2423 [Paraburkholderia sp. BL27I4N3]|nr:hypothetical protein B0G71_2423 [Paraburkholderia sp. BL27I4N3]
MRPGSDEEPKEAASGLEVHSLPGGLVSQLPDAWRHAVVLVQVDNVPMRSCARLEELGGAGTTDQPTCRRLICLFRVQREPSARTRRRRNKQRNKYFPPTHYPPGKRCAHDEQEIIMAECSVCGKPATSQITITENGQRRQLMLCDEGVVTLTRRRHNTCTRHVFAQAGDGFWASSVKRCHAAKRSASSLR